MIKVAGICKLIGCSGFNSACPGNPDCQIIRKFLRHFDLEDQELNSRQIIRKKIR